MQPDPEVRLLEQKKHDLLDEINRLQQVKQNIAIPTKNIDPEVRLLERRKNDLTKELEVLAKNRHQVIKDTQGQITILIREKDQLIEEITLLLDKKNKEEKVYEQLKVDYFQFNQGKLKQLDDEITRKTKEIDDKLATANQELERSRQTNQAQLAREQEFKKQADSLRQREVFISQETDRLNELKLKTDEEINIANKKLNELNNEIESSISSIRCNTDRVDKLEEKIKSRQEYWKYNETKLDTRQTQLDSKEQGLIQLTENLKNREIELNNLKRQLDDRQAVLMRAADDLRRRYGQK